MYILYLLLILFGAVLFGVYLTVHLSRRRAVERSAILVADTVRLGLPLAPMIEAAARDARLWERAVLRRLAENLREGYPLDRAMQRSSILWPPVILGYVRQASRNGRLGTMMEHVRDAVVARRRHEMAAFAPMLYLGLMGVAVTGMIGFVGVFVAPRFEDVLEDFGIATPLGWVVPLVAFVALPAAWLLGMVLLVLFVLLLAGRLMSGRSGWLGRLVDLGRRWLPGLRRAELLGGLAVVARRMATAIEAGQSTDDVLDQAAEPGVNALVRRRVSKVARLHAEQGVPLAEAFARTRGFPRAWRWVVRTGEAAGNLPDALQNLADRYEATCDRRQVVIWNAAQVAGVLVAGLIVAGQALMCFLFLDAAYGVLLN